MTIRNRRWLPELLESGRLSLLLMLVLATCWGRASAPEIVVSETAPALERKAAVLLETYLREVFGARAKVRPVASGEGGVVFFVGSPASNPAMPAGLAERVGKLDGQTIRIVGDAQSLAVAGGSPAATLWAVAELGERWGVRITLDGDVMPERRPFAPGALDIRLEPAFPVRCWRAVNDFAYGMEGWGAGDYRGLLEQLAKLRFNRILFSIYPWQPFLDFEAGGIHRNSATLWYGYRYPITPRTIGRKLFGGATEFWNPDIPRNATYPEMAAAGRTLIQTTMREADELGMEIALSVTLTDFPIEFAPLLPGARKIHQLGSMDIVPGPGVKASDPALGELAAAVLRASVNTYPEVDYLAVSMPEHRDWVDQSAEAWERLNATYGVDEVRTLEGMVEAARNRPDYPGGTERAVKEVQGDVVALSFCDLLLKQRKVLEGTARPDARIIYTALAEELYPVLSRVLPRDSELMSFIDYTPTRILNRRGVLRQVPPHIPATLLYTFQDDNIGLLPQLTALSLEQIAAEQREHGWSGFVTRHWISREAEPAILWAARSAWNPEQRVVPFYAAYARDLCGERGAQAFAAGLAEMEAVTQILEKHALGFGFPIPGMMLKNWTEEAFPPELESAIESYQRAEAHFRRAAGKSAKAGRRAAEWWAGRCAFASYYLQAARALREAARADAEGKSKEALALARSSYELARKAIEVYAGVARDRSDLGAIAVLNEYVEVPLRSKLEEMAKSR